MDQEFTIEYTKELPGWDEFNKSVRGKAFIEAPTKEEAISKFESDAKYKYCFIDAVGLFKNLHRVAMSDVCNPDW